ncbi:MAG: aminotransferase class I/II-fold pyridoxal phosphate-dependent enzyme [Bacteroidota bacterium]
MDEAILDLLKILKAEALALEPSEKEREEARTKVVAYTERFLNQIDELKAYQTTDYKSKGLLEHPISNTPAPIESLLSLLENFVDTPGINSASGGHLGYIPGGGLYYSALGDYLAAVFNRYAGVNFSAPGAVQMEKVVLQWMASLIDFPSSFGGNLTSGTSIASLIAFVTAREAKSLTSKDYHRSVVYLSDLAHHSQEKALKIAGLGDAVKRHIPIDDHFRMIPEALEDAVKKDLEVGLKPWLVVATIGTTDTGSIDPLEELAAISAQYDLWYHVDAAYGGFFILTETGRNLMKGIEKADSVVLDPHKGLSVPFGLGAVLVRDQAEMVRAHQFEANYMQDAKVVADVSPAEVSPELSKHFRALRLWLPLMVHGVEPFRQNLEEKLLLAQYFQAKIKSIPHFEVGPDPDLSITIFRYVPDAGDANEFNQRLVKAIHEDGRVFLSSTVLDGKFTLRMAIVSFRTHLETIDLALEVIQQCVQKLLSEERLIENE